jgi:hypothetical protein
MLAVASLIIIKDAEINGEEVIFVKLPVVIAIDA